MKMAILLILKKFSYYSADMAIKSEMFAIL